MNERFVNIKVDREERPDIDSVYIEATQAMTGQAGWPMTCFLTPDGEPFHCGTYYPARPVHGMPSFRATLEEESLYYDSEFSCQIKYSWRTFSFQYKSTSLNKKEPQYDFYYLPIHLEFLAGEEILLEKLKRLILKD